MEVCLLYQEKDMLSDGGYPYKNDIVKDLRLDVLFREMSRNDKYIASICRSVMLKPLQNKKDIMYRQSILNDLISHPKAIKEIYEETREAKREIEHIRVEETKTNVYGTKMMQIYQSLESLKILIKHIKQLKALINMYDTDFTSAGMKKFCETFSTEYSENAIKQMDQSMDEMHFLTEGGEITFSASIGEGMKSSHIIVNHLKKGEDKKKYEIGLLKKMYYQYLKKDVILLEDQTLIQNARQMEEAGLFHILKIYDDYIKDLINFFDSLRYQSGFYVGCLNLYDRTEQFFTDTCMPKVVEGKHAFHMDGLYDMVLAIDLRRLPVCNDLEMKDMDLVVITGANQGGKSTFLRSVGIAQVMMQAGMFVPAKEYSSCIYDAIFTHFSRREDTEMNSGKLDEELIRMNHIIEDITPNSFILLNEPFATTTEAEGSKIAFDITKALYETKIMVMIVTHLYEYSKQIFGLDLDHAYFLGAERLEDGTRTFKMLEHEPKETSYGLDLYDRIIERQNSDV